MRAEELSFYLILRASEASVSKDEVKGLKALNRVRFDVQVQRYARRDLGPA